jgi:TolA-binding protein
LPIIAAQDWATLGTFLGGAGVILGAVATFVMRKDTKRTTELQLAQEIQRNVFDQTVKRLETTEERLGDANKTIDDLRAQQRQSDERAIISDRKYQELEQRHHDCEVGRRTLETQLQVVMMTVEELKRDRDSDR